MATTRKKTAKKTPARKRAAAKTAAKKTRRSAPAVAKTAAKKAAKEPPRAAVAKKRGAATSRAKAGTTTRKAAASTKRTAAAAKKSATALPRRAIFVDVENTSSEQALLEVIQGLAIDHRKRRTELTAVGNWRVVGQHVGRHLGALGAQLVHSAPAKGVRDWSDLWIAVAAGVWIGQAQPGDLLEIVSNDRAFDAVGDAAAARGVEYTRIQHRRGASPAPAPEAESEERPARRPRRRRRRPVREATAATDTTPTAAAPRAAAAPSSDPDLEPHGATRDQMIALIARLTNNDAERWVNLDILERELKREGFSRPPGSPRLVTRLRVLKDVEVDSHGRVRIAPGTPVPDFVPAEAEELQEGAAANANGAAKPAAKRRRRRRSKSANGETGAASESATEPAAAAPAVAAAAPKRRPRRRRKPADAGATGDAPASEAAAPAVATEIKSDAAPKRRSRRRSKAVTAVEEPTA